MKKVINIKIVIDGDTVGSIIDMQGFHPNSAEAKLIVVGALENLKRNQLNKLDNIYSKIKTKDLNTGEIKDEDEKD